MNKEIARAIKQLAALDIKESDLLKESDAILHSSPVGQLPPIHDRILDKVIDIQKKKAIVWNSIRSYSIGRKNLWWLACESNLPVKSFGPEEYLAISAIDIQKLIEDSLLTSPDNQ